MAGFKETKFNDRIGTAQAARQAQLEKVKALAAAAKEKAGERAAERAAIAKARDERQAQRAEEKRLAAAEAEKRHHAEEETRRKVEAEAKLAAQRAKEEESEKMRTLLTDQKAARDAKYAARKERNKKKR
jgi:murein DD-endopeptidase MepM/ murein hydrolase activator NlpD